MHSYSKLIAVTLSLLGAASASPLIPRGSCKPNFQGNNLVISNEGTPVWNPPEPAYRVEFSGQWPDSYLIKLADPSSHDTVVAATGQTAGSELTEVPINFSSSDPLQIWDIRCDVCSDPVPNTKFTTGCVVTLRASPAVCMQVSYGTQHLVMADCNGFNSQKFDFEMA